MTKFWLKLRYVFHVISCGDCGVMAKCRIRAGLLAEWRATASTLAPRLGLESQHSLLTAINAGIDAREAERERLKQERLVGQYDDRQWGAKQLVTTADLVKASPWPAVPTPELWNNPAKRLIQIADARVVMVPLGAYVAQPYRFMERQSPDQEWLSQWMLGQIEIDLLSAGTYELNEPDWKIWLLHDGEKPVELCGMRIWAGGDSTKDDTSFRFEDATLIGQPNGEQHTQASIFLKARINTGRLRLRLYLNGWPIRGSDFPLRVTALDVDGLRREAESNQRRKTKKGRSK